ncbi:hypothetical protein [Sulfurovum riftiae]|uniref:Porin n=1 Tax=Sulfurovum riftiae TaxID=1630136 RepID=A0A151CF65_9BACT|nr:hypothetical protein [Sulfurovum riftiae]KYJ86114.1 hypothetical protein AS592_01750 [Sulfurovum riftiae]
MKKALLLSVVASVAVMAGGDIAPAPVVEETSNWEWSGTAKVYYQTMDHQNFVYGALGAGGLNILPYGGLPGGGVAGPIVGADNDMFDRRSSAADAGLQLRVSNKDVIAGIGFGAELTGLSTLNLVDYGVVTGSMQSVGEQDAFLNGTKDADNALSGAWISQAYLTYGIANTSIKIGRQELPKSLSPFAFSEGWNIFKNTFEAALVVNTDLPDTTLVGAYVTRANGSRSWAGSIVAITSTHDMADWERIADDGVYMLTAQNKSIAGLTATGTYYYAPSAIKGGGVNGADVDVDVLWGDLAYNTADFPVEFGLQGGYLDASDIVVDSTTAWGVKVGGHWGDFSALAAYTGVDTDGGLTVTNFGTGVKSPLYTQMVLNQIFIDGHQGDVDTWMIKGIYKGLGGKFIAAYGASDVEDGLDGNDHDFNEFDFIYATKFNTAYGDLGLKAMWINQDFDWGSNNPNRDDSGNTGAFIPETNNVIRLIASYDF